MRNHLWCPNDPRGKGIDDDDDYQEEKGKEEAVRKREKIDKI